MLVTTEVLALKGVRYSDTASIVQAYSQDFGTLSFKVSRSTTPRRQRSGASATRYLLYPLSLLSVTFDHQLTRDIFTLRETSLIHLPHRPSSHPTANALALFTSELLSRLLRTDGGQDKPLFDYLKGEILALDEMPLTQLPSFHIRLLSGLLHHFGIFPQLSSYRVGYVLDHSDGLFRPAFNQQEEAEARTYHTLLSFFHSDTPLELPLTRVERNALLRLLLAHLTYHFPEVGTLRSPEILSQLF